MTKTGNHGRRWSMEDIHRLKQISMLYDIQELAIIFERTESAIISELHRYQLKHRNSPPEIPSEPEGFKYCPDCQTLLPYDAFSKKKGGRYGLTRQCRSCLNHARQTKGREKKLTRMAEEHNQMKQTLLGTYKAQLTSEELYCPQCQEQKTLANYSFTIRKRKVGYVATKQCLDCQRRKKLERIQRRGF